MNTCWYVFTCFLYDLSQVQQGVVSNSTQQTITSNKTSSENEEHTVNFKNTPVLSEESDNTDDYEDDSSSLDQKFLLYKYPVRYDVSDMEWWTTWFNLH